MRVSGGVITAIGSARGTLNGIRSTWCGSVPRGRHAGVGVIVICVGRRRRPTTDLGASRTEDRVRVVEVDYYATGSVWQVRVASSPLAGVVSRRWPVRCG